jgi:hypothetical protein
MKGKDMTNNRKDLLVMVRDILEGAIKEVDINPDAAVVAFTNIEGSHPVDPPLEKDIKMVSIVFHADHNGAVFRILRVSDEEIERMKNERPKEIGH